MMVMKLFVSRYNRIYLRSLILGSLLVHCEQDICAADLAEHVQKRPDTLVTQGNERLLSIAERVVSQSQSAYPESTNNSLPEAVVKAGPFRVERANLLESIKKAQHLGIGIQNYLAAFKSLEEKVEAGASAVEIQARLNPLVRSINEQFSHQQEKTQSVSRVTGKLLSLEDARFYALSLINAERLKYKFPPLSLDPMASAAGQMHANEMATIGYLSHWNSGGVKPDQRYTENGGMHSVTENLGVLTVASEIIQPSNEYRIQKEQRFSKDALRKLHSLFMLEKPPNDGHRKQILNPDHNKVGFGISASMNSAGDQHLYVAQEFLDAYGEYAKLPKTARRGMPFNVSGKLFPGVKLYSVSVRWEPMPKPIENEMLEKTPRHYGTPKTSVADYFPEDSPSTVKVQTQGKNQSFSVTITPNENWNDGLYYILVCATHSHRKTPIIISARTIQLQ